MSKEKEKTGLNRDSSDKFYTKPEIAIQCIQDFKDNISYDKDRDVYIEPSAGSGSFSDTLYDEFQNTLAYDIDPDPNNEDCLPNGGFPIT